MEGGNIPPPLPSGGLAAKAVNHSLIVEVRDLVALQLYIVPKMCPLRCLAEGAAQEIHDRNKTCIKYPCQPPERLHDQAFGQIFLLFLSLFYYAIQYMV